MSFPSATEMVGRGGFGLANPAPVGCCPFVTQAGPLVKHVLAVGTVSTRSTGPDKKLARQVGIEPPPPLRVAARE